MKIAKLLAAVLTLLVLSACGTTSDIKPVGAPPADNAAAPPEQSTKASAKAAAEAAVASAIAAYQRYDRVVVLDFVDGTDKTKISADKRIAFDEAMKIAVRDFADRIAGEIRKTGVFTQVLREPAEGEALRISGTITRYASGNAMLRLLIGFGAGSSYFDATVDLSDNTSAEKLGQVIVDKNSWGLGGAIAASQNVEGFMQGAAEKIAKDLASAKREPVVSSSED